jgi:hypothetical protein
MRAQVVSLEERRRQYPDILPVSSFSGSTGTMTMTSGISGVNFASGGETIYSAAHASTGFPCHAEEPHVARLEQEVAVLKKEISEMKGLVSQYLGAHEGTALEIRDVPLDQAKEEIAAYFKEHHGEVVDAADLQEALGIDVGTAIQACEELEEEGRIKTA